MSWARLDDRANEHPKQLAAGAEACWLWACGLMYANRQPARDGFIPGIALRALYVQAKRPDRLAEKLVEVGLWDKVEGGWIIHDYLVWNKTKEQLEAEREAARERMRAVRANRKRTEGEQPPEHGAKFADGSGSTPTPLQSTPDPEPPKPPASRRGKRRAGLWHRVPADWEPRPEDVELGRKLAKEHGIDVPLELASYRDHEFSAGKLDADSTWRNWLRGAVKRSRGRGTGKPPGLQQHEDNGRLPSNYKLFPVVAEVGRRVPERPRRPSQAPPAGSDPAALEAQRVAEEAQAKADRERWEREFEAERKGKAS